MRAVLDAGGTTSKNAAAPLIAPRSVRQNGERMATTVLIVDDHEAFRASARLLLESEGFEVVGEAADGGSAIEQTISLAPDLILLDVQLPDIDGFEVASRLTHTDGAPTVILVSSRDRGDYGPLVKSSGARGFVAKADLSGDSVRALLDA
jgi:DNA-binding NarL/FixJ family response regulator